MDNENFLMDHFMEEDKLGPAFETMKEEYEEKVFLQPNRLLFTEDAIKDLERQLQENEVDLKRHIPSGIRKEVYMYTIDSDTTLDQYIERIKRSVEKLKFELRDTIAMQKAFLPFLIEKREQLKKDYRTIEIIGYPGMESKVVDLLYEYLEGHYFVQNREEFDMHFNDKHKLSGVFPKNIIWLQDYGVLKALFDFLIREGFIEFGTVNKLIGLHFTKPIDDTNTLMSEERFVLSQNKWTTKKSYLDLMRLSLPDLVKLNNPTLRANEIILEDQEQFSPVDKGTQKTIVQLKSNQAMKLFYQLLLLKQNHNTIK